MATIFHDDDADLAVLAGSSVAVVGYGNQGRSWALNLRDSGFDVRVCVRADASRDQAAADGFTPVELEDASDADVVCVLVPDDVIPSLPLTRKADGLTIVASGYTLAFDRFEPDGDVGMIAPRMLGPEVRRCYEEGIGFITAVGVHRDVTGRRAGTHARGRQGDRRAAPGRHRAHAAAGGDPRPRRRAGAVARADARQQHVRAGDARARDPARGDHHRARALGRGRAHHAARARGRLRGAVRVPFADEPVRPADAPRGLRRRPRSGRRCAASSTTSPRAGSPTSGMPSATPATRSSSRLREQHAGPAVREFEQALRRELGPRAGVE